MGVLLATDFAIKELIAYFPFIVSTEDEARRLINQVIHKSAEEISNFFLDLLGMTEIVFEFVAKFNELLNEKEATNRDEKKLTSNLTPNKHTSIERVPKNKDVKGISVSSRRQKKTNASSGTTTSEMLLKRIHKLNHKQKAKKVEPEKAPPKDKENHDETEKVSALPDNLQKFENLPMTEASINAMSKYFQEMQVQRQLKNTTKTDAAKICGCQSLVHGLYTLSPNCLKCGKIICNLEAKQTGGERCVFCNESLLSSEQIDDYLGVLMLDKMRMKLTSKQEELQKLNEKKRDIYSRDKKSGNTKVHMNLQGGSLRGGYINKDILNNQVETILAEGKKKNLKVKDMLEADPDIIALKDEIFNLENIINLESQKCEEDNALKDAQKRLDTLLNFQNTSEERTKIIDIAGDFDFGVSGDVKALFEGTAEERALKIKLKQRNLKLLKEQELQRVGRGKSEFIFDIDRNGNVSVEQKNMDLSKNNKASTEVVVDEEDQELLTELNALREKIYDLKLKDFEISSKKMFNPKDPKNVLADSKYVSNSGSTNAAVSNKYKEFILKPGQRENIGIAMGSLEENVALFI